GSHRVVEGKRRGRAVQQPPLERGRARLRHGRDPRQRQGAQGGHDGGGGAGGPHARGGLRRAGRNLRAKTRPAPIVHQGSQGPVNRAAAVALYTLIELTRRRILLVFFIVGALGIAAIGIGLKVFSSAVTGSVTFGPPGSAPPDPALL